MDNRLHKVYSNNSKKSRLKRRKNKFYREWNAETQTYVKKRKSQYPAPTSRTTSTAKMTEKDIDAEMKRCEERHKRHVSFMAMKEKALKANKKTAKKVNFSRPEKAPKKSDYTKIGGVLMEWVPEQLKYRKVA